ncbi:MAG: TIGR03016 family PEP-CTERM system-associated outer membrane protein [Gammaproteobacteria bacterium]
MGVTKTRRSRTCRYTSYVPSCLLLGGCLLAASLTGYAASKDEQPRSRSRTYGTERQPADDAPAYPRTWRIVPRIALSETYTTNVTLGSGEGKLDDFVTQLNPELKAEFNGRRLQADLDFRMQNLFYAKNSDFNDTFYQYDAEAKAEIFEDRVFVEATSNLWQEIISTDGRFAFNNLAVTTNRTDVLTASVSPYWRQPLGSVAETLVRYQYGIVDFLDNQAFGETDDSRLHALSLAVNSLPKERRFSWSLQYGQQRIDYVNSDVATDNLKFERAQTEIGYRITAPLQIIAVGGYENNDFGATTVSENDPQGAIWQAGVRWQPGLHSQLEATFGRRFFGNTYRILWKQTGQHLASELGYTEELETDAGALLVGGKGLTKTLENVVLRGVSRTPDVFLAKRFLARGTLAMPRSEFRLDLFDVNRDFLTRGGNNRTRGINADWNWQAWPRTAVIFGFLWYQNEPRGSDREDRPAQVSATVRRQIGPDTTGSLEVAHTRVDSDEPEFAYTDTSITVNLTHSF